MVATRKQNEICATARVEVKSNGIVIWQVASESGHTYNVVVFDGKVSSCERTDGEPCNGWRYRHSCHHTTLVVEREAERSTERRLTREEYTAEFGIYQ